MRSSSWFGVRCLRTSLACVVAALAILSCTTPTLPLPPPEDPEITQGTTAGVWHLHSDNGATPDSIVIAFNENPNVPRDQRVTGTEADDNGTWDLEVIASPGDLIEITQQVGNVTSPSINVNIPNE